MRQISEPCEDAEGQAKAAYLNHARRLGQIRSNTCLANEFVLGSSGIRADLAIFDTQLTVIEVKTARDSLRRLPRQLAAYRRFADKLVLVVAENHLKSASFPQTPDAEIWSISLDGEISQIQSYTPSYTAISFLPLLTQAETRRLARQGRLTNPAALEMISKRFAASSETFWNEAKGRRIQPAHLTGLSRFASLRARAEKQSLLEREMWERWRDDAARIFDGQLGNLAA